MPAALEACVTKVMAKGHDQSSAFAICRTSLGIKDGEDGAGMEKTDAEIDAIAAAAPAPEMTQRIEPAAIDQTVVEPEKEATAAPALGASFVKDIIVARAGRNFRNGKQEFDLTHRDIEGIIANFASLGKQVPLVLAPNHDMVFGGRKSAIPAAGWVEKMYLDGDDWHAVCKFVGDVATAVANDQYRGVSIGTILARDPHGREVGEALDHLLITNSPFFPNLNIAAQESAASVDGRVRYITASQADEPEVAKEPGMAADTPTPDILKAAIDAAVSARDEEIVRKERENLSLAEENVTLKKQLQDYCPPAEKKALVEKIESLKETAFVAQIRAIVHRALTEGRFAPVWCKGYDGKDALDNAGTLRWFRASKFFDSALPNADEQGFRFLRFASETFPVLYRMGQTYASGVPVPGAPAKGLICSNEEKAAIRARGFDPERITTLSDEMTFAEWQAATGHTGKETK